MVPSGVVGYCHEPAMDPHDFVILHCRPSESLEKMDQPEFRYVTAILANCLERSREDAEAKIKIRSSCLVRHSPSTFETRVRPWKLRRGLP
jgi:hypothetical protein